MWVLFFKLESEKNQSWIQYVCIDDSHERNIWEGIFVLVVCALSGLVWWPGQNFMFCHIPCKLVNVSDSQHVWLYTVSVNCTSMKLFVAAIYKTLWIIKHHIILQAKTYYESVCISNLIRFYWSPFSEEYCFADNSRTVTKSFVNFGKFDLKGNALNMGFLYT